MIIKIRKFNTHMKYPWTGRILFDVMNFSKINYVVKVYHRRNTITVIEQTATEMG
jgi:hypothetical protein